MVNAGEMTLEFVIRDGMVVVYPDDHGEPVRAQGAEAKQVLTTRTSRARHSDLRRFYPELSPLPFLKNLDGGARSDCRQTSVPAARSDSRS
jgi:hypothetical protein